MKRAAQYRICSVFNFSCSYRITVQDEYLLLCKMWCCLLFYQCIFTLASFSCIHRTIFIYISIPDFAFPYLSAGITSLCTVALIAVERMFVVCKPLGLIIFEKKHAIGGIALSWLWSLTWNLPPLFGWGRYELEGVGTSCAPDWHTRDPHHVSYILAYFAVCFAVPFAVILASYTKLMWTLHRVSIWLLHRQW